MKRLPPSEIPEIVRTHCESLRDGSESLRDADKVNPPQFHFTDTQWQELTSCLERARKLTPKRSTEPLTLKDLFYVSHSDRPRREGPAECYIRDELEIAISGFLEGRSFPQSDRQYTTAADRLVKFGIPLLSELVLSERALLVVCSRFGREARFCRLQGELYELLMAVRRSRVTGLPTNVDFPRNYIWRLAGRIYEGVTGRRVGASHRVASKERSGAASGPFVSFIQTLMAAIPGEQVPSGDEVRWFARRRYYRRR